MAVNVANDVVAMHWKAEGSDGANHIGPLWYVTKTGKYINYKDSDTPKGDGEFFAEWFTESNAKQISKGLDLTLE